MGLNWGPQIAQRVCLARKIGKRSGAKQRRKKFPVAVKKRFLRASGGVIPYHEKDLRGRTNMLNWKRIMVKGVRGTIGIRKKPGKPTVKNLKNSKGGSRKRGLGKWESEWESKVEKKKKKYAKVMGRWRLDALKSKRLAGLWRGVTVVTKLERA